MPDDGTDYGDYTSKWEYLGKGCVKVDRQNILAIQYVPQWQKHQTRVIFSV
jgi:hypothetical protein